MKWLVNGLNWVTTRAGSLFARRAPVIVEETAEQVAARTAARINEARAVAAEARAATAKAESSIATGNARAARIGRIVSGTTKTAVVGGGAVAGGYLVSREIKKEQESTGNPVADAFNDVKEFVTQNLGFGMGSLIGAGALAIIGGLLTASPVVAIAAAVLGMFVGQPVFENLTAAFKQSPTDPNAAGAATTAGDTPAEQQAPELAVNLQANLPSRTGDNPSRTGSHTRTT